MLSLDNSAQMGFDSASEPAAAFRLDGYFRDHAVLQRNQVIPVRGYAVPDTVVEATLCGISARGIVASDGRFTVNFPPMPASRGQLLQVTNAGKVIRCEDISIGEVYLVAGQSNMEFPLKNCIPGPEIAEEADYAALRYFKIPAKSYYGRQHTLHGCWQKISSGNVGDISGCGFFFGRRIAVETGLPIGLIDASLGGMNLESWVSREALLSVPAYREELLAYESSVSLQGTDDDGKLPLDDRKICDGLKRLFPEPPEDGKLAEGWASENFADGDWEEMLLPDSWTEAGHNHAGIFWFRRDIDIPAEWAGKELELHLGAIDKSDKVYFNGCCIGGMGDACTWDFWATRRVYAIPADSVKPGRNLLAVQVGSMASICMDGGMLGPASDMYITLPEKSDCPRISLAGPWRYRESYDAGTIGMTFMRSLGAGAPGSFHMLYDNMIFPLSGIPMRGVLWYQGEANAICMAKLYEPLLKAMLDDWRRTIGNPELEFFIIQLPDYHNPHYFAPFSQWALVREAQNNVAAQDEYADCIVTLGMGDVVELHAKNKKAVGEAAARCALARLRGETPPCGPQLKQVRRVPGGGSLLLCFTGKDLPPAGTRFRGFAIAGENGRAFAAKAETLDSATVRVSSPEVPEPTRVWYAWATNPSAFDLRDADGNPASPFRAALDAPAEQAAAVNLLP